MQWLSVNRADLVESEEALNECDRLAQPASAAFGLVPESGAFQ
jgi:hypothetical protein